MEHLVEHIRNKNFDAANKALLEKLTLIAEQKLLEMKKACAANEDTGLLRAVKKPLGQRLKLRKPSALANRKIAARPLEEMFSDAQLAQLKSEYSKIDRVDPSGPAYKKLIALLNKMDQKSLKKVADMNIKFVSSLARNRVKQPLKEEEINEREAVSLDNPEFNAIKKIDSQKMMATIKKILTPEEYKIIIARLVNDKTLSQISKMMNMRIEKVRQIEARASRKIMNPSHNIKSFSKSFEEEVDLEGLTEEELIEARIKIVRARIRGGKIQRRKKVSNVPGMTIRGGKLTRMSIAERRRRKLGARRGKIKRRAKKSQMLRKRKISLMKRKRLGI